jgi:hypothetical protein
MWQSSRFGRETAPVFGLSLAGYIELSNSQPQVLELIQGGAGREQMWRLGAGHDPVAIEFTLYADAAWPRAVGKNHSRQTSS